jgi:arsenate reductase
MTQAKGILFFCVANSARSQMAEGFARKMFGTRVQVQSAGSSPSRINLYAVAVMREVGIDIAGQHAKSAGSIDANAVDTVITLCAEELCPAFPGAVRRLHWPFPDPAHYEASASREGVMAQFREVRDGIRQKLEAFQREASL